MKTKETRCQRFIFGKQCKEKSINGSRYCKNHQKIFKNQTFAVGHTQFQGHKTSDTYQNYINSDSWKERSKRERSFWNNHCVLCHRSKNTLHVHHSSYVRLGNEQHGDLIVLCDECHQLFHQFYQYDSSTGCFVPKPGLINLLRKIVG